MDLDVLVFAAHPDDAELNAGGTISRLVSESLSVGLVDLTKGEMGTRGTAEIRAKEVEEATKVLGISYRTNLNLGDSILENSEENQLAIIREVRAKRPKLCIIGASYDRHPDHSKATQLCIDALFYSGLSKLESIDDNGNQQSAWRPGHIIQYMQDRPFDPDFILDISEHWEQKKKAILAFDTQFNVTEPGSEPETYISSNRYFKQLEARARYFGHLGGFEFGEPFKVVNGPLGLRTMSIFF
ncbi:MAG: bacillithiol biosynthesis deacetylase BshB1 [Balneola sp.]|nr:MAG: bacillithiol biosynthesis deacetylase BshB1 [Balneola sp.]